MTVGRLLFGVAATGFGAAGASSAGPEAGFETLAGERYVSLTTFRRSGEPVATPVWFALLPGPRVVVTTGATSGKVRRLRNDPSCTLAACDVRGRAHGPEVAATARLLAEDEAEAARAALARVYGWQWRSLQLVRRLRRRALATVELELVPSAAAGDAT